jgi:hypothetical protein
LYREECGKKQLHSHAFRVAAFPDCEPKSYRSAIHPRVDVQLARLKSVSQRGQRRGGSDRTNGLPKEAIRHPQLGHRANICAYIIDKAKTLMVTHSRR